MQNPSKQTDSRTSRSDAATTYATWRPSSSVDIAGMRSSSVIVSRPGNGSTAATAHPDVDARSATRSSNSGRSPMMSGITTMPRVGASGVTISTGVPDGKFVRMRACLLHAKRDEVGSVGVLHGSAAPVDGLGDGGVQLDSLPFGQHPVVGG